MIPTIAAAPVYRCMPVTVLMLLWLSELGISGLVQAIRLSGSVAAIKPQEITLLLDRHAACLVSHDSRPHRPQQY